MLVTAMAHSAITTERKAPWAPMCRPTASPQASGISKTQNPKKFTIVGVTVSPAPLNACNITIT